MSADKDAKAGPAGAGPRTTTTTRTVVGVPALPEVPPDRPSDLEMTRQLPPKDAGDEMVLGTADVTALSPADAEKVLARTPGVAGALPRPGASPTAPGKTLPPSPEMFVGLRSSHTPKASTIEKPTRPGIAPQPGFTAAGRATLLLDSSAPPGSQAAEGDPSVERPPIVVPGTSAMPSKAVTQPPPWGAGAVKMAPGLAQGPGKMREPAPSAEELSSSLLMADASSELGAVEAEELSGSVLIEDSPDGKGPVVTKPPVPNSAHPPPAHPSVKPPVPKSTSAHPAAHRALLGMPDLPKTTPGPKLDVHPTVAKTSSTPPPLPTTMGAPVAQAFVEPAPPPVSFPPGYIPPPDMPADFVPPVMPDFPAPPSKEAPSPTASAPLPQFPMPPDHTGALPANAAAAAYPHPHIPPLGSDVPTSPMTGDIELTRLPRQGLQPALDKVRELASKVGPALATLRPLLEKARPHVQRLARKAGPAFQRARVVVTERVAVLSRDRPKWFWPAVVSGGLFVGIGLVAIIVSAARGGGGDAKADGRASPSAVGSAGLLGAKPGAPVAPAAAPSPATASTTACTVSGPPHVIGPSATVTAGVEVVRIGDDLALGFAPSDHDAIAVRIDPASLSASGTTRVHTRDTVKRVTPIANVKGGLSLVADVDRRADRLQGRRTVLSDPALQVGVSNGHVAFARLGGAPAGELWAMDDASPVDAVRGAVDAGGDHAIALAFRRPGTVWMGVASASPAPTPRGDLSHIEGLGPAVGSPAIAIGGGVVMAAWSDRASSDDPWKLRWTHFDAGGAPTASDTFHPPAGGRGEQAMSPALTALPGGRFLLVWTEGPTSGHDVRAVTLSSDGKMLGAPLVISNPGINAGQAQVAVAGSGQGAAAFLETGGNGFQIVATPIACGDGS